MTKTAIVIGGASCVWRDLEEARKLFPDADLIAVNDIGTEIKDPLRAWVSLHGWELLRIWMPMRAAKGYLLAEETYSGLDAGDQKNVRDYITHCVEAKFDGQEHGGSSGLFGVKIALVDLGYDQVVCAGIPMIDAPHYFAGHPTDIAVDGNNPVWTSATSYWVGWFEAMPHLKGKVFSMSGWTREQLGAPKGAGPEPEGIPAPRVSPPKLGAVDRGWKHWCPGCNEFHILPTRPEDGAEGRWKFNGDMINPTFTPSFKHIVGRGKKESPAICHYVLTNGILNFCDDCTHSLANKAVPLPLLSEANNDKED